MPEASIASMTSPEHGAQQECNSTFFCSLGGVRVGRVISVISKNSLHRRMSALRHALGNHGFDDGGVQRFVVVKPDQVVKLGAGLHPIEHIVGVAVARDRLI